MSRPGTKERFAEYLTVSEAAEFLGVSPWTLRNWDKSGKLKPRRHPKNGYRIYRHEDLEALLEPEEFLGRPNGTLTPTFDWNAVGESEHFVQFYETDRFLMDSVSEFLAAGLAAGDTAIVIATRAHRLGIQKRLKARGLELAAARARGQLVVLDAAEALSKFMADGAPDRQRFMDAVGSVIQTAAEGGRRVRAFGEMVALLWDEGRRDAAVRLEELWNELAKTSAFALLCAYPLPSVAGDDQGESFQSVCTCHTRVIPSESYTALPDSDERLREIALLQQRARSLEAEIAHRREVEQTLLRRERELSDFFENATEGLHRVGPDGTILWANTAEMDLLGYDPDEYIGHHIAEFHADADTIGDILQRLLRGESITNYAARLRCKSGAIRHVLINSSGYFEDGEFIHTRCFTRDMTEQWEINQALWQSEQRFTRFMQSLPGLAWIKNGDGRYVFANEAAEAAFQRTTEELFGRTDDELFPPETAARFQRNDQQALASVSGLQVVETLAHPDGVLHHSLVTKFPISGPDGERPLIGGMAIDITDRVRAEEALREADRRKDEFLATLAHELRNPLAPICNSLQVLRLTENVDLSVRQLCEVIERQAHQLVRLVDDLLEVSRITRGKIELRKERVELAAVLANAVETSQPMVDAAGHQLTVALPAEPISFEADPVRLAQVFTNLLNNAAKYTEAGGHIHLAAGREPSEVVVSIRDNGLGIPPEMLTRIFEAFSQVDQTVSRAQGGLGIGLTLAKNCIEMHGGRITAFSAGPGQGSEFVVRLPVTPDAKPSMPSTPTSDATESSLPQRRVLIVDDTKAAAFMLGKLLEALGQSVRIASDASSALEMALLERPDLVISDIGMPQMDGYELARRLRQEPELRNIVLVAATGYGQDADREQAHAAGFDHYLVKPVSVESLRALLKSLPVPPAARET